MVAKNAFLLFASFAVVYSAPAGFDLEGTAGSAAKSTQAGFNLEGTTGSPAKLGFDFDRIGSWIGQGQKVIGDAGKSFGDRIKGGMQGQGLIGQGIKNGPDALQQRQQDFGESIKGGIQQGQDLIAKGIKHVQNAIKKGQDGIKNNVQIGIPKPYNSLKQQP